MTTSADHEIEKLEYMWNSGYQRWDEYEKNPSWARDFEEEEHELEDGEFTVPVTRFVYKRGEDDESYIQSTLVYNLMSVR